jgi:hypothetical protein
MNSKEIVLNNIIGLNPTGTLDFNNTYTMVGDNSIVKDANSASKDNLKESSQNKIVCGSIENFENYNNNNNNNKNKEFILIILFLVILLILYFL